jgi:lipoprotein-anchoring transpeptidase ErfK/SrfK
MFDVRHPLCAILGLLLLAPVLGARVQPRTHQRKAASAVSSDPVRVNDPKLMNRIGPGARGSAVVRAQILLDRAGFSSSEIDGTFGKNLQNTVAAYQESHGLKATGSIGLETWQALNADSSPAVQQYTIAHEDVAGPFEKIPADLMEQSKLSSLGYESPLDGLAEKFHCAPKLLTAWNRGKSFDKEGETITAPSVAAGPLPKAASVVVDGSDLSVSALDENGKVLAHFPASVGSVHDPLPVGTWKILGLRRNPIFHYNPKLFWDADGKQSKAEIAPGPRNPVGVVWISLSKGHY